MYILLLLLLISIIFIAVVWRHLFFRNKFTPPTGLMGLEPRSVQGIPFLVENGLPYPAGIQSASQPHISLDGDWNFYLENDPKPCSVRVPHCFNTTDSVLRDFEGAVIYEKSITLPAPAEGHLIRLAFLGSFYQTDVWLDDQWVGSHAGGYLPFYFDLTPFGKTGAGYRLKVRVDNRLNLQSLPQRLYPGHNVGWQPYGGLHRSVYIEICPPQYCFKLRVEADLDTGQVKVAALFHAHHRTSPRLNTASLRLLTYDRSLLAHADTPIQWDEGSEYGAAFHTFSVSTPQAWEPTSPTLYRIEIQTGEELCGTNFGFRSLATQDGKLLVNHQAHILKGVCRHQEDRFTGLAQNVDSVRQDLNAIREMNANFVRLAHYPHSSETLDLCDEMGLFAWVEIPLYQAGLGIIRFLFDKTKSTTGKSWRDLPKILWATQALEDHRLLVGARNELLKMIERDSNHPSILFWGLGNECWSLHPSAAAALAWLRAQAEAFNKSQLFAYAAFALPYLGVRYERAFEIADVVGVNEYFGWYYGKIEDATPYLQSLARKFPHKPLLVTETGADSVRGQHAAEVPPRLGYSEEYQAGLLEKQWRQMRLIPTFAGLSIWVLKDFLCPEYREDSPVPFYNIKGLLDRDSQPKLAYHKMSELYREE